MTGQSQTRSGERSATRVLRDGVSSTADLSNVIPFTRARRTGAEPYAPPVIVNPTDRPAPLLPGTRPWPQALLVMGSLMLHGGLFYALLQEKQLPPGTGSQGMTVEIIVGDNRPLGPGSNAGLAPQQGDHFEDVRPEKEAEEDQKAAETGEVKPQETRAEVTNERSLEEPKEQEQRRAAAMVETPEAEIPTARETPPDVRAIVTVPPDQPQQAKPVEPKQKRRDRGDDGASGSGVSILSEANYLGRVAAHLKRYQEYPDAARNKRITGTGTILFSIDERGYVTSANVDTTSGSVLLDEEMTAMARRASPFPASPDGRPRAFKVPVTFELKSKRARPL
jgi:protein TonB